MVPAHNAERYLGRALDSIQAQTMAQWEAIVVDDGSTDDTLAIAEAYAASDPRIRVHAHTTNQGVSAARNSALQDVKTPYLSMLDADDRMEADQLAVLLNALEASDYGLAFASYELYDDTGVLQPDHIQTVARLSFDHESGATQTLEEPFTALLPGSFISNSCVLVSTPSAVAAGGWDTDLKVGADRIFYLRLSRLATFAYVPQVLAKKENRPDRLSAPSLDDAIRRVQVALVARTLCQTDDERAAADEVVASATQNACYRASTSGALPYARTLKTLRRMAAPAAFSVRDLARAFFGARK